MIAKVLKIAIAQNKGFEMKNVNSVKALQGKGLANDRKFKENNQKELQITLIEIENINYYNQISKSNIAPIDFRRNIITENIKLNDLVGKEFFVGSVKLKAHDLCRPCRYLQEKLNQKNFVKDLLFIAGLRCEILSSGTMIVGDIIK